MKTPAYIFFDYGNTIVSERPHDRLAGVAALWEYVYYNPNEISPKCFAAKLDEIDKIIGRYDINNPYIDQFEFHQCDIFRALFEQCQIKANISYEEMEYVYWKAACGGEQTNGLDRLLDYLSYRGVKSAVVSNLTYSGKTLRKRIDEIIPNNQFEFCLASSDYVFRKPFDIFFNVALAKAKIDASQAWFVGDVARLDIDGAINVGMVGFWYCSDLKFKDEPNKNGYVIINSWDDLYTILQNTD